MRRQFKWDKKYLYWGVTAFCVIACSIIFYLTFDRIAVVGKFIKKLVDILSPFIWGLIITYLLAPLTKRLAKAFRPFTARLYKNSKKHSGRKLARGLAVLCSEVVLLLIRRRYLCVCW